MMNYFRIFKQTISYYISDNLDPKRNLTDLDLWQAIDKCDAKSIILKLGMINYLIFQQMNELIMMLFFQRWS